MEQAGAPRADPPPMAPAGRSCPSGPSGPSSPWLSSSWRALWSRHWPPLCASQPCAPSKSSRSRCRHSEYRYTYLVSIAIVRVSVGVRVKVGVGVGGRVRVTLLLPVLSSSFSLQAARSAF
eukprot:scaffold37869_cov48-Phaeocystis_antarctica.AAC.1